MGEDSQEGEILQNAEQLKAALAEQDLLQQEFQKATLADSYKEDIDLEPHYVEVTTIKMTPNLFLVQHIPTEILKGFSTMTGPRRLREGIVEFVDDIEEKFPNQKQ